MINGWKLRPAPRQGRTAGPAPVALLALVTLAAAACDADVPAEDASPPDVDEQTQRPAEARRTIEVEGMEEEIVVRLYRTPDTFPLPFSTYLPEWMAAQEIAAGEGDAVAFVAEFGGERNEAAAVRLIVAPEGMAEADLIDLLRGVVEGLEGSLAPSEHILFPWASQEFSIEPRGAHAYGVGGVVGVGSRHDRAFAIAVHYPPEYGDGFAPRAALILDAWRWEDSGDPLRP
jgi:hypothetical protein